MNESPFHIPSSMLDIYHIHLNEFTCDKNAGIFDFSQNIKCLTQSGGEVLPGITVYRIVINMYTNTI